MVWEQQQSLPRHELAWVLSPSPAQDTGSPENGGAGNRRLLTKTSFPSGQVFFKLYLKNKLSKSASLSNYFLSLQQLKLRFKEHDFFFFLNQHAFLSWHQLSRAGGTPKPL